MPRRRSIAPVVLVLLTSAGACASPTQDTTPQRGTTGPQTSFTLSGTVEEPYGNPIAGVPVAISGGPNDGSSTKTSAAGTFTFTNLSAGAFKLTASAPGYETQSDFVQLPGTTKVDFRMPYPNYQVTGLISSLDTGMPIVGARVYLGHNESVLTDATGHYHGPADASNGPFATGNNLGWAVADGYESNTQFLRSTSFDLPLHSVQQLALDTPLTVTVAPGDSLCATEHWDPSFGDEFLCRTVHVMPTAAGRLTIDVVSSNGARPQLEVDTRSDHCCAGLLGNPSVVTVAPGVDVIINIEPPWPATTSQTFVVMARMAEPQILPAAWDILTPVRASLRRSQTRPGQR